MGHGRDLCGEIWLESLDSAAKEPVRLRPQAWLNTPGEQGHKTHASHKGSHGDVLVLGKPLGVGVLSAALKKGQLDAAGYAEMLRHTTQLNRVGMALAQIDGVHAMTDVTGFGLAGHLLEICRGSQLSAQVDLERLPLIPSAVQWAREGVSTGASGRNWAAYGTDVDWPETAPDWQRTLLTDPQTSGGLLVSCAPEVADAVVRAFHGDGFAQAAIVGRMQESNPRQGHRLRCA